MKSTMNWQEKTLEEASKLSGKGTKWKDMPKGLKFRLRLVNFLWDWFSWDAVKSGWKMPRLHFRSWLFYKRHPFLKKLHQKEQQ